MPSGDVADRARGWDARLIGPAHPEGSEIAPHARGAARLIALIEATPAADLAAWEPAYGRLAEAQVKWEATHGRSLEVV